ncbi:MAG: hypothetical protein E7608_06905 [Ruminococcaceae bacterium]|nr:hypothetical protein [Oscillospiraceae bacterium]
MSHIKTALLYLVKIALIFIFTLIIYLPLQLILTSAVQNSGDTSKTLLIYGIFGIIFELILIFVLFYKDFCNEKNLDVKSFTIPFAIALIMQLIIASINHFYIYTAGCGVSFIGQFIQASKAGVIPQTPNEVPLSYYLIITFIADILRYLTVFFAYKAAKQKHKKEKAELLSQTKNAG